MNVTPLSRRTRRIVSAALFATLSLVAFPAGAQLPDPRPLDAPRISPLAADPDAERPTLNVTATIANHPRLAEAWLGFARYVLSDENTLPTRDREILILRIGWLCQAEYEWGQHSRVASRAGMSDEEIVRISKGAEAPGWTPHERALIRAADELRRDAFIHDATWATLAETYSTEQLMDVVFTVGEYNLVSMALRSFGVQREEGIGGFPE